MNALTTTIDRKVFLSRATAFLTKREISRLNVASNHSYYRLEHVLGEVARYGKYNEEDGLPFSYNQACYAIGWAIQTSRLSAQTVIALKAMKVRDLLILIHKVAANCPVMGDVPAYLSTLVLQPAA